MTLPIWELVVKCVVPTEEVEDYVVRLRAGDQLFPVPEGLTVKDAFDCYESGDPKLTILSVRYGRS